MCCTDYIIITDWVLARWSVQRTGVLRPRTVETVSADIYHAQVQRVISELHRGIKRTSPLKKRLLSWAGEIKGSDLYSKLNVCGICSALYSIHQCRGNDAAHQWIISAKLRRAATHAWVFRLNVELQKVFVVFKLSPKPAKIQSR